MKQAIKIILIIIALALVAYSQWPVVRVLTASKVIYLVDADGQRVGSLEFDDELTVTIKKVAP